jgi:hypothetical protein
MAKPSPTPAPKTRSFAAPSTTPARPAPVAKQPVIDSTADGQVFGPIMGDNPIFSRDDRDEEKAKQDAEDERAKREEILGITTGALATTPDLIKDQVKRLTDEEYARLTTRQRAAVDFNTLLSSAVRKDLKRQEQYKNVGDQAKLQYETNVENMFGEDHGSDLYAPETMAVLRQLKLDDPNDDLDDYLGLKVAITENDLKDLTDKQPAPNYAIEGRTSEATRDKMPVVEGLVDKTLDLQEKLTRGQQMLQSFKATAAAEIRESGDLARMGVEPRGGKPAIGFMPAKFNEQGEPTDLNSYFQKSFDLLSSTAQEKNRSEILKQVTEFLHPDELESFLAYADARTRNTRLYGSDLGLGEGEYSTPKELRKLLGLGPVRG